jgi:hypothetical protein
VLERIQTALLPESQGGIPITIIMDNMADKIWDVFGNYWKIGYFFQVAEPEALIRPYIRLGGCYCGYCQYVHRLPLWTMWCGNPG